MQQPKRSVKTGTCTKKGKKLGRNLGDFLYPPVMSTFILKIFTNQCSTPYRYTTIIPDVIINLLYVVF